MSGYPRPNWLYSYQHRENQVLEQAPLSFVQASILSANACEVGQDGVVLVVRPWKVIRKPATGQAPNDLGIHARGTTNGRDEGA
jgi:hypothetical protein